MPTKSRTPRLNPKVAHFKLRIGPSHIERFGVFAEEPIPSEKRVIEYTGERISGKEALRRAIKMLTKGKADRIYSIRLDSRSKLDGSVGGSGAEFVNHSCDPNLTMRKIRGRIFLYSFRKIRAGEELTVDYGFHCSCPCRCGASTCRGTICRV